MRSHLLLLLFLALSLLFLSSPSLRVHAQTTSSTGALGNSSASTNTGVEDDAATVAVFPPKVLSYHAAGGDNKGWMQTSPDGRFLCGAVAVSQRGGSIHCWRRADATSLGRNVSGLANGGLPVIRVTLALAGAKSTIREMNFKPDGTELYLLVGLPARLYSYARSVETGELTDPRLLYTHGTSTSFYSPFLVCMASFSGGGLLLAVNQGQLLSFRQAPNRTLTLIRTDTRLWTETTYLVRTRDEQCLYGQNQQRVGTFAITPESLVNGTVGEYTPTLESNNAGLSGWMRLSPDERWLFSGDGQSFSAWQRDPNSCNLTLVYTHWRLSNQYSPDRVTMSPNGRDVLVGYAGGGRMLLQHYTLDRNDSSGQRNFTFRALLPVPPTVVQRAQPIFTDDQQLLLWTGANELYSLRLEHALAQPVTVAEPAWNASFPYLQMQAGSWGDNMAAVATADGRFLYSTSGVTDLLTYALEPVTGARIDGGQRIATPESRKTQSNVAYVTSYTVLFSLTISSDQRFLYGYGLEMHSFVRDPSDGLPVNRSVLALPPQGRWRAVVPVSFLGPQLYAADDRSVRLFWTDPEQGAVLLPSTDPSDTTNGTGIVWTPPALSFAPLSCLAADQGVVYVGGAQRTIHVLQRNPLNGSLATAPLQVVVTGTGSTSGSVVSMQLTASFLYTFDDVGSFQVYSRAASGFLSLVQTAVPPLALSFSYSCATLWTNARQALVVAGLRSGEVVIYRRNLVTGIVDLPTLIVPPGEPSSLFRLQARVISLAIAGGTLYTTAASADTIPGGHLQELGTNNYVLPVPPEIPGGLGSNNYSTNATVVNFRPFMKAFLRMPGSPLDGRGFAYRPSLLSAPLALNGRCGQRPSTVSMPVFLLSKFSSASSSDACTLSEATHQNTNSPCFAVVIDAGGCSMTRKLQNMVDRISPAVVLVVDYPSSASGMLHADPGRVDDFELPPLGSGALSPDDVGFQLAKVVLHVDAVEATPLREMLALHCGVNDCGNLRLELPSLGIADPDKQSLAESQYRALERFADASRWDDPRLDLRPFLPLYNEWNRSRSNTEWVVKPIARLPGVQIEQGVVVSLTLEGWGGTDGSVPDLLGEFTHLRSLRIVSSPRLGSMTPRLCELHHLTYLHISASSLDWLPDCFGASNMPFLQHWHVSDTNMHLLPPSVARGAATTLSWIGFSGNREASSIGNSVAVTQQDPSLSPPADFILSAQVLPDLTALRSLVYLNLSRAGLVGSISSVRSSTWAQLQLLALDGNSLEGQVSASWFDRNPELRIVSFAGLGGVRGPLPSFRGCMSLQSLSLAGCSLSGPIPGEWVQLTSLRTLDLAGNRVSDPLTPLRGLSSLVFADLSSNAIGCAATGTFDELLQSMPVEIQTLRLDGNLLGNCAWISAVSSVAASPQLLALSASRSGLKSLPSDLFSPSLAWRLLDFSWNALREPISDSYPPSATLLKLSLQGNNISTPASATRPAWLQLDLSVLSQSAGDRFECPTVSLQSNPTALLQLPSSYFGFLGCECVSGTFGTAPDCRLQLSELDLLPRNEGLQSPPPLLPPPAPASDAASVLSTASLVAQLGQTGVISDAFFGPARATPGVNTDYFLRAPAGTRVVRTLILINVALFNRRSDVLTLERGTDGSEAQRGGLGVGAHVLQGDALEALPLIDLCAARNLSVNGGSSSLDLLQGNMSSLLASADPAESLAALLSSALSFAPLEHTAYVSGVADSLASMCLVRVWMVDTYASSATLNFRSSGVGGAYFVATAAFSPQCPQGLHADPESAGCMPVYDVSALPFQIICALAALLVLVLAVILVVFVSQRHSAVMRASMLPLQVFILGALLCLCVGSVVYASNPLAPGSNALCHLRAWLTGVGVVAILATLFARAAHVINIYASQGLKVQSEMVIYAWITLALAGELLLLCFFSAYELAHAQLVTQSSLPDVLLLQCSTQRGFWPWLGVQLGYLLLLLLPAVRVAFRARKLPLFFNESASLFNGLVILALTAVTVLPAALGVSGAATPETSQAVQAAGQLMLAAAWSGALLGPRLLQLKQQRATELKKVLAPALSVVGPADGKVAAAPQIPSLHTISSASPVMPLDNAGYQSPVSSPTSESSSSSSMVAAAQVTGFRSPAAGQSHAVGFSGLASLAGPGGRYVLPGQLSSMGLSGSAGAAPHASALSVLPFSAPPQSQIVRVHMGPSSAAAAPVSPVVEEEGASGSDTAANSARSNQADGSAPSTQRSRVSEEKASSPAPRLPTDAREKALWESVLAPIARVHHSAGQRWLEAMRAESFSSPQADSPSSLSALNGATTPTPLPSSRRQQGEPASLAGIRLDGTKGDDSARSEVASVSGGSVDANAPLWLESSRVAAAIASLTVDARQRVGDECARFLRAIDTAVCAAMMTAPLAHGKPHAENNVDFGAALPSSPSANTSSPSLGALPPLVPRPTSPAWPSTSELASTTSAPSLDARAMRVLWSSGVLRALDRCEWNMPDGSSQAGGFRDAIAAAGLAASGSSPSVAGNSHMVRGVEDADSPGSSPSAHSRHSSSAALSETQCTALCLLVQRVHTSLLPCLTAVRDVAAAAPSSSGGAGSASPASPAAPASPSASPGSAASSAGERASPDDGGSV